MNSNEKTPEIDPTLHPLPGGKDGDSLRAKPDEVRDRDWPTAAFTPEDVFLKELAYQEAQDVEAANNRAATTPAPVKPTT